MSLYDKLIPVLKWKKTIIAILTPLILLGLPIAYHTQEAKCLFLLILMAVYWMTEALPLAVTGLLPIVFFPLFGILDTSRTCNQYMKEAIMIGLGSILIATAIEHCSLHKRIALKVLLGVGSSSKWLLLGFMFTTMILAMWIGPTPTVAMMVPIVDAVLTELNHPTIKKSSSFEIKNVVDYNNSYIADSQLELSTGSSEKEIVISDEDEENELNQKKLRKVMMLGVCYAANVGGTGTLPATAPNLVFKSVLENQFPHYNRLNFTSWMLFNLPGMIICFIIIWIILVGLYVRKLETTRDKDDSKRLKDFLRQKYKELGIMTFHETAILILFITLAVLWFFRDPEFMPGWADLFPSVKVSDATSTLAVAALLFVIPANPKETGSSPTLLDWKTAQDKMAWGVLLLLGGGFALAEGAEQSGFSTWVGNELSNLKSIDPVVLSLILCIVLLILIEAAGNTAVATIVLPVAGKLAYSFKINPMLILLPMAVCTSYAFMFPVAAASNAIIFESAKMKVKEMALPGILVKIICLGVAMFITNTLGVSMFDLHSFHHEDWNRTYVLLRNSSY